MKEGDGDLSIPALVVVIASAVLAIAVLAFQEPLGKFEWLDIEVIGTIALAGSALGSLLGWLSLKSKAGKIAAFGGTLVLLGLLMQLLSTS